MFLQVFHEPCKVQLTHFFGTNGVAAKNALGIDGEDGGRHGLGVGGWQVAIGGAGAEPNAEVLNAGEEGLRGLGFADGEDEEFLRVGVGVESLELGDEFAAVGGRGAEEDEQNGPDTALCTEENLGTTRPVDEVDL